VAVRVCKNETQHLLSLVGTPSYTGCQTRRLAERRKGYDKRGRQQEVAWQAWVLKNGRARGFAGWWRPGSVHGVGVCRLTRMHASGVVQSQSGSTRGSAPRRGDRPQRASLACDRSLPALSSAVCSQRGEAREIRSSLTSGMARGHLQQTLVRWRGSTRAAHLTWGEA
jgi:hypothetical protein